MYRNRPRRGKGEFSTSLHNCQTLINGDWDENGRVFIRFLFHVLLYNRGIAAYFTSNFTDKSQLTYADIKLGKYKVSFARSDVDFVNLRLRLGSLDT